jgi:hypothetical protein
MIRVQPRRDQAMMTRHRLSRVLPHLGLFALVYGPASLVAQEETSPGQQFQEQLAADAKAIRGYTWERRTEVEVNGETKSVKLQQVRYDIDGNQQATDIAGNEGTQQTQENGRERRGRGRIAGRVMEKKKAELQELIEGLMRTAQTYAKPDPDKMQAFIQGAERSFEGDVLAIRGRGLAETEDEVEIKIDTASFLPRHYAVETTYDDEPLTMAIDFRKTDEIPNHAARMVLEYPNKDLRVQIENYDHRRTN